MYKIIEKQRNVKVQYESSIYGVLSYLEKRGLSKRDVESVREALEHKRGIVLEDGTGYMEYSVFETYPSYLSEEEKKVKKKKSRFTIENNDLHENGKEVYGYSVVRDDKYGTKVKASYETNGTPMDNYTFGVKVTLLQTTIDIPEEDKIESLRDVLRFMLDGEDEEVD